MQAGTEDKQRFGCSCGNNSKSNAVRCIDCLYYWHRECANYNGDPVEFYCNTCVGDDIIDITKNLDSMNIASGGVTPENIIPAIRTEPPTNVTKPTGAVPKQKPIQTAVPKNLVTSFVNNQSTPEVRDVYNAAVTLLDQSRQLHKRMIDERARNDEQLRRALHGINQLKQSYEESLGELNGLRYSSTRRETTPRREEQRNYSFPSFPNQNRRQDNRERGNRQNNRALPNEYEDPEVSLGQAIAAGFLDNRRVEELPKFSGKDLQLWVKFRATYRYQVRSGVSVDKRISNLSSALVDEAYDLVADHLIFREDPDMIMAELESYYGDPERILDKLMTDVIHAKAPKDLPKNQLIHFAILVKRLVTNIRYLDRPEQMYSLFIERNIIRKLRDEHKDQWCSIKRDDPAANLETLSQFLIQRARDYSAQMPDYTPRNNRPANTRPLPRQVNFHDTNVQETSMADSNDYNDAHSELEHEQDDPNLFVGNVKYNSYQRQRTTPTGCFECGGTHRMVSCRLFLIRDVNQRLKLVTEKKLCTSCLSSGEHESSQCETRRECVIGDCKSYHHWLLHGSTLNPEPENDSLQKKQFVGHCGGKAQYGIVPLMVKAVNGDEKLVYAMLDLGSGVTLMSKSLFDELGLNGRPSTLSISWADSKTKAIETSNRTCLEVSIPGKGNKIMLNGVYTFKGLCLPVQSQIKAETIKYKHLQGIDLPEFHNVQPQILIGLPHANLCAGRQLKSGGPNEPVANKTSLGWVLYGNVEKDQQNSSNFPIVSVMKYENIHGKCDKCDSYMHDMVHYYMSIDSFGINKTKKILSGEEKQVEKIVKQTLTYDQERKRYRIGLFWKDGDVNLPNSRQMALKRLIAVERSLSKRNLMDWANDRFNELLAKGYVRKANEDDLNTNWRKVFYLPIVVVVNENKIPPKPRLVLDGAAEVDGKSLNSFLLAGPDLLAPMIGVIIQMRERQYVVAGDAKEMFHQIDIIPEDQQCQRVLWRYGNSEVQPEVYIWQVMTFGLKSSPATSQLVKNYHADLWKNKNKLASEAAKNNVFVDDYVKSHDTFEETVETTKASIELFESMGLSLVNFQSNYATVLAQLPQSNVKADIIDLDRDYQPNFMTKILGMKWHPTEDVFIYKPTNDKQMTEIEQLCVGTTKRQLLKIVMKIFDPLGLVAHILIQGKIIIQNVWRDGTDWDSPVEIKHLEGLRRWANILLQELPNLKIPRWYAPVIPEDTNVQLHVFCDASEEAMAAAAYLRFKDNNNTWVSLVSAKTKVMPLRTLSIPKAELTAAVMAVRLASSLKKLISFRVMNTMFWTDSKCVLAQINSERKLQQFFATRVEEILENSTRKQWRHITSKENPADYGTKWHDDASKLTCIWFSGPQMLKLGEIEWPQDDDSGTNESILISYVVSEVIEQPLLKELSAKTLDNWTRLRRVVAYRIRFVKAKFLKLEHETAFLSTQELLLAEEIIFAAIQSDAFPDEYALLKAGQQIESGSKLYQFTPFMSNTGVIRMKSRLQNNAFSYSTRNPAILPNKHRLVDSMVKYLHERNHHQNENMTIEIIRKKGWIINLRKLVRRVSNNCSTCKIIRATPTVPIMGDLPICRTDVEAYPFEHCGVDCFGPMHVAVGRARVQRYGLIFVCMTIRAIHLEPLEDMSTRSCLSAVQNFTSLYGPPKHFYSDCGTNFVGLAGIFRKIITSLASTVADFIGVTWHFNPPYTPHFGGSWERLIQSTKRMMKMMEHEHRVQNDYDLRNVFYQISDQLNERPLTPIPVNPDEELPPSPKQFIRLNARQSIVLQPPNEDHLHQLKLEKLSEVSDQLVKKFIRDYLPVITKRTKWFKAERSLEVDDVVLMVDFSMPKIKWRRAIVNQLFPGKDGRPRVAEIRTKSGLRRTGVVNLARLDIRSPPPSPLDDTVADGGVDVGV